MRLLTLIAVIIAMIAVHYKVAEPLNNVLDLIVGVPLLIFFVSSLGKPNELNKAKMSEYWNRYMWGWCFAIYAFFVCCAIACLTYDSNEYYVAYILATIVFIAPVPILYKQVRTLDIQDQALLLVFGKARCTVTPGIWFLLKKVCVLLAFPPTQFQYEFPKDATEIGEDGKPQEITTGEKVVHTKSPDHNGRTTSSIRKFDDAMSENDTLSIIMMLSVTIIVAFEFSDLSLLYKKFGDKYKEGGYKKVVQEVARQMRDQVFIAALAIFPKKTAAEIFEDQDTINTEIFNKVRVILGSWGVNTIEAKLATISYSKKTIDAMEEVAQTNLELLEELNKANNDAKKVEIAANAEAKRIKTETEAMKQRAKEMEANPMLAQLFKLQVAEKIATGSTNINIGNLGGLGLDHLLGDLFKQKK